MKRSLRRLLLGKPLESARLTHERLSIPKALAILSSDALSSVAYAAEEILIVMVPLLGLLSFNYLTPISMAIILLIFIVSFSYKKVIDAYPHSGGGAYVVAKDNLGVNAGLVAAAALLFDYLLTVAVSITAGVAAFTSAFQQFLPYKVSIALFLIAFLVLVNLRGITESATVFSYPTFFFILGMFVLIGVGLVKILLGGATSAPAALPNETPTNLTGYALTFLILRAFSSGCTALTGIEAVSNSVPTFKPPEAKHAKMVLTILSIFLFVMFAGTIYFAKAFHIVPSEKMTVISQIAATVFGKNILFYLFQASTMLILVLAANTSFAGFPLLASLVARDSYAPRYLALRGDRLVFSNGIISLGVLAGLLVVIFKGNTTSLIPLYAVGVFTSFTLAQSGMVVRWLKTKAPHWQTKALINGIGALITGMVTLIIAVTKFQSGAWVVVIIIPVLVKLFRMVHKHYQEIKFELDVDRFVPHDSTKHTIIIPVASLTNVVANTLEYAKTISDDIRAVHISVDKEATEKTKRKWEQHYKDLPLIIIEAPFRAILQPLMKYIDEAEASRAENEVITVLIPEFIARKWWHNLMHNQTGLTLQNLLVLRSNIIVAAVPYHLRQ